MSHDFNFEAKDVQIKEVLFNDYLKFRIPRFQRPYAWTDDQIQDFWNDLSSSDKTYFLGSLIFNKEYEEATGYTEIIDGQQRLLTITIFCAVLRDLLGSISSDEAEFCQRKDIELEGRKKGEKTYRILPGESTKEFFKKYIQEMGNDVLSSSPKTGEEQRIKENYRFLYSKISSELSRLEQNEAKIEYLSKLREKVSDLIVIDINIKSEDDAYEIFETTNARGVDLSVADLLKNLIFKKIRADDDRDIAREVWGEITGNVEETGTEVKKFIRYYWLSKHSFVTEKRIFKEIKKKITDWVDLLNQLCFTSEWYNKLYKGTEIDFADLKNGHKIYKSIFSIRLMAVSQCYILLITILRNYSKLKTDPTRIFQMIEKFTFLYSVVCKMPGNRVEKIYSQYALRLEEAIHAGYSTEEKRSAKIQQVFSDLLKELAREAPPVDFFKKSFNDIAYKSSSQGRKIIAYILSEFDSYYRGDNPEEKIDFDNVNIEHVLPVKPDDDWGLTEKDIAEYVNKLGNLTLLSKKLNSKVQSKVVSKKIKEYKDSKLPITKKLVEELESYDCQWDKEKIEKRQDEFAEIAYKRIWKLAL